MMSFFCILGARAPFELLQSREILHIVGLEIPILVLLCDRPKIVADFLENNPNLLLDSDDQLILQIKDLPILSYVFLPDMLIPLC